MNIRTCDVIESSGVNARLVVVATQSDRLHAAQIIDVEAGESETLAMPGTYLASNLGKIAIIDSWKPERIARKLAECLFRDFPDAQEKDYQRWLESLNKSFDTDPPYSSS